SDAPGSPPHFPSPNKCRHTVTVQLGSRKLASMRNVEPLPLRAVVKHDEDMPPFRSFEGHVWERRWRARRDAHRAWPHEFRPVRNNVVGRIARYLIAVN